MAIGQASGMLPEHLGLDMRQAFELLRGQARVQNRALAEPEHPMMPAWYASHDARRPGSRS